jgi:lysophospholipase L1-like esterase
MLLKKAGLVLFGVLVAAAAGEWFLRAIGFGQLTPQMSFGAQAERALERGYFDPDETLFWKPRPNRNPRFQREANLVHPDAPIPPRGTRQRLIVIGDSCSRLVPGGLPYSASIQSELGGDQWEVFNASVPGYSSHQGLLWLRSQLLAAEPDVVVLYFGWNDHWRTPGRTDRQYEQSMRPGRLRLLNLLDRRPDPPPFRVPRDEYRENLRTMIDDVARKGGRVVLVAAPYHFTEKSLQRYVEDAYLLPEDDALAIHRSYLEIVREFSGRDRVSILGADLIFEALGDTPPLLRDDGIHLTRKGHLVMGTLIAEQLRSGAGRDGSAAPALLNAARHTLAAAAEAEAEVREQADGDPS